MKYPSEIRDSKLIYSVLALCVNSVKFNSQIEHLRLEQSNTDFFVLTEHIKDYLGLIGAIKDVFHERVKVDY